MRAVEGDIVTVHWKCVNEAGETLESSRASNEPTTFEVGAGDVVGNRLFEAFDEAVRGLAVGETMGLKVKRIIKCIIALGGGVCLLLDAAEQLIFFPCPSQIEGAPWEQDLLFKVPRDHQEVQRLEGRYKK